MALESSQGSPLAIACAEVHLSSVSKIRENGYFRFPCFLLFMLFQEGLGGREGFSNDPEPKSEQCQIWRWFNAKRLLWRWTNAKILALDQRYFGVGSMPKGTFGVEPMPKTFWRWINAKLFFIWRWI